MLLPRPAAHLPGKDEPDDGALLDRFVLHRDENAFAELLQRHGRMVYGVSRKLLNNAADADDVCQATFLLLARKAGGLSRERSVAGWLVGVLRRVAADVRKRNRRRLQRESQVIRKSSDTSPTDAPLLASAKELGQLLDTEIATLPRKYREPILLCCLEGLSKAAVAQRLGWPEGTVAGRLFRAKALLKARLQRKGVVPAVALALLSGAVQSQASPHPFAPAIYQLALTGPAQLKTIISAPVYSLFQGAWKTMWIAKLKLGTAAIAATAALAWLGWGMTSPTVAESPVTPKTGLTETTDDQTAKREQEKLQGTWHAVAVVFGGKVHEKVRKDADVMLQQTKLIFEGDKIQISGSPSEGKPTAFKLNAQANPKQLEVMIGEGKSIKALYALEGGVLLFRFDEGNDARPTSLAVGEDSAGGLLIFQRQRPGGQAAGKNADIPGRNYAITMNNMRQIAIAQHNHHNDFGHLADNICDAQGKPLLSWRVKLLPYLEQDALFKQFKLDEPWDSTHNKSLIDKMPRVFSLVNNVADDFKTPFCSFRGNGALLETGKKVTFPEVTDGLSNTIMVVEAAEPVTWTKPDDLMFDPQKSLPALGGKDQDWFVVVMCDGSAHRYRTSLKPETIKKLITKAGKEPIDQTELEVRKP